MVISDIHETIKGRVFNIVNSHVRDYDGGTEPRLTKNRGECDVSGLSGESFQSAEQRQTYIIHDCFEIRD